MPRILSRLSINSKLSSALYRNSQRNNYRVVLFFIQQNWLLLAHLEWHVEWWETWQIFLVIFLSQLTLGCPQVVCTILSAWPFAWGWWGVIVTGWMSSSFTDFLNTYEINADPLPGIINLEIWTLKSPSTELFLWKQRYFKKVPTRSMKFLSLQNK